MADILQFLLVPDKAAARMVRRVLASDGARFGVVVGTWGELVDQANRAYLLPPPATDWEERLGEAARNLPDPFWSGSLKADPKNTLSIIGGELCRLLDALGPGKIPEPAGTCSLSARGKRHLFDLSRLHVAMGRILPDALAAISGLIAAEKSEAVRLIVVHRKNGFPCLSPWQEALLAKLVSDCGSSPDPGLEAILSRMLDPPPAGKNRSALRHLQENLFRIGASRARLDGSVACLAVRDHLEAAEVPAGMAQKALASGGILNYSDIGLLIPSDGSCDESVREVFSSAGLPLSGLEDPSRFRNLGGEVVFHFLATRRRPAPAMALAAVYASPVMPWDEATGNRLAMGIMDGKFKPETPEDFGAGERQMMELLREEPTTPEALGDALKAFSSLLSMSESMARHVEVARGAVGTLIEALRKTKEKEVPWEDLTTLVPQAPTPSDSALELTREGVAVFREDEEPWRSVRLLYVLGFSEGRYPSGPPRSLLFDPADTASLKSELGYVIESADERMARQRDLFLRQVRVASDRAVFLATLRDAMGDALASSGTFAFMTRLFEGIQAPEDLLITLERESDRGKVDGLPLAPPADPEWPRLIEIRDLALKGNLLEDPSGKRKSISASSLETLMVSPLGWFLERSAILPLSWAPEELNPLKKGILAHAVFEDLFLAGTPLLTAEKIQSEIERLLNKAVLNRAPFLLGSEWSLEKKNLLKEVETAALRWREMLDRFGAKILGVETTIVGMFEDVPIRGRTDLLLSLPSGRILVVDYKKSSSSDRQKCMEKGYDVQTSIYRHMLRSGEVVDGGGEALAKTLKAGAEIGVLYYMMDDQRALTDTLDWIPRTVSGVWELGGGISVNGEVWVKERIRALRDGNLPLNRESDEAELRKIGIKAYALEKSPLITRFMHPAPVPALEEEEAE